MVEKAEKVWWKKLLRGDGKAPHYIKVDWDKWADEDEDNGLLFLYFILSSSFFLFLSRNISGKCMPVNWKFINFYCLLQDLQMILI